MTLTDKEKLLVIIPLAVENSVSLGMDSNETYKKLVEMKKSMYPSMNDGEILEIYEDVARFMAEAAHNALSLAWRHGN